MMKKRANTREVTAAERGQIVQRVLVDRWSAADAATSFRVSERQVSRWVRAYRRRGMASLKATGASDRAMARWAAQLRAMLARIGAVLDGEARRTHEVARCIVLRRDGDARGSDKPSERRSHWN